MAPSDRNVRVYTVNHESRYVEVGNIPAVGVVDEAVKRLNLFGEIENHRVLPHTESTDFTERILVQYETINNARHAKYRAKHKPVMGSVLEVVYAPQYETAEDTANKLRERREMILRRATPRQSIRTTREHRQDQSTEGHRQTTQEQQVDFIGPRRPETSQMQSASSDQHPGLSSTKPERWKRRRI